MVNCAYAGNRAIKKEWKFGRGEKVCKEKMQKREGTFRENQMLKWGPEEGKAELVEGRRKRMQSIRVEL